MAYVNFTDYQSNAWNDTQDVPDEATFNKYAPLADIVLDEVTNYAYTIAGLDSETDTFTKNQFINAWCSQLSYEAQNGYTTIDDGDDDEIQSFSAGRTSLNFGSSTAKTGVNSSAFNKVLSANVRRLLIPTGLLYRGLSNA
jgi:hypothetical protein